MNNIQSKLKKKKLNSYCIVYVLYNKFTDEIIGICEDKDTIIRYAYQYNDYVSKNCIIKALSGKDANKILEYSLSEMYYIQELTPNILMTDYEIEYYTPFFKNMYLAMMDSLDTINMMTNIFVFSKNEISNLNNTSSIIHHKAPSYEEFLENIDSQYILNCVLKEPLSVKSELYTYSDTLFKLKDSSRFKNLE